MSRKHGILAAILLAAVCLTAVPAARTEAAAQKVVTRSVSKTRFEKVKNSSLHGYHVGNSGSSFRPVWFGDYVAVCTSVETKVNDTSFFDDAVLQITKDGVSYRNYDLAEFV